MNCKMNMITGIMNFTEGRLGVSIIDKRTPIIVPFAPRYLGKHVYCIGLFIISEIMAILYNLTNTSCSHISIIA